MIDFLPGHTYIHTHIALSFEDFFCSSAPFASEMGHLRTIQTAQGCCTRFDGKQCAGGVGLQGRAPPPEGGVVAGRFIEGQGGGLV